MRGRCWFLFWYVSVKIWPSFLFFFSTRHDFSVYFFYTFLFALFWHPQKTWSISPKQRPLRAFVEFCPKLRYFLGAQTVAFHAQIVVSRPHKRMPKKLGLIPFSAWSDQGQLLTVRSMLRMFTDHLWDILLMLQESHKTTWDGFKTLSIMG